jgi:hypothetical protein
MPYVVRGRSKRRRKRRKKKKEKSFQSVHLCAGKQVRENLLGIQGVVLRLEM